MFKPKRAKRELSSEMLMVTPSLSPSTFPGNYIGPTEIVDFDPGEAILSQMLLRNLDSDMNLTMASQQQKVSAAVGLGLGLGIGFADLAMDSAKREKIIMTCERRGSESTITSSHNSHGGCSQLSPPFPHSPKLYRQRFTLESTASDTILYEPASPLWKGKTLDLPPSPVSPAGDAYGQEQGMIPFPSQDAIIDRPPPLEPTVENTGLGGCRSSEQEPRSDDDATPRALSPVKG
jgi:hypothetical protein